MDKSRVMNAFDYFLKILPNWQVPPSCRTGGDHLQGPLQLLPPFWVDRNKSTYIPASVNNVPFFLKAYLAIIKSGNICIPLDPSIEKDNFKYIHDLTQPKLTFLTPGCRKEAGTQLIGDKCFNQHPEAFEYKAMAEGGP